MSFRNKNWMVSLILLLSFSMAFPFCCHTDISDFFSHHQDSSVHASQAQHQDASDCNCGHELRKDFQKNKKQLGSTSPDVSPSLMAMGSIETANSFALSYIPAADTFKTFFLPPLHLLNSVFLN